MKTIVFSIAIVATVLLACNNSNNNTKEEAKTSDPKTTNAPSGTATNQQSASVDEAVTAYLHLKNGLTNDNSKGAAEAGKHLHEAMQKLDNASFSAEQKKVYDDVKE